MKNNCSEIIREFLGKFLQQRSLAGFKNATLPSNLKRSDLFFLLILIAVNIGQTITGSQNKSY